MAVCTHELNVLLLPALVTELLYLKLKLYWDRSSEVAHISVLGL